MNLPKGDGKWTSSDTEILGKHLFIKKVFETSNNELFITSYIGTFFSKSTNCNYKLYVAGLIK
jgi:hypothetical protein